MIIHPGLNNYEILHDDCAMHRRFISQASDEALGAIYNGDASIVLVTDQEFTRALGVDGTGDYVDYGNLDVANFATRDCSIEVIFNRASGLSAGEDLISKRADATNTAGFLFGINNADVIFFEIDDGVGNEVNKGGTTDVADGTYKHGLLTLNRSGFATLYVNGLSDATQDISSVGSLSNSINLQVGRLNDGSREFTGQIAMFRIWNRALTADEAILLAAMSGFGSGSKFDLNRGLVSYWPLADLSSTVVPDLKGNNDGTPTSLDESDVVTGYNYTRRGVGYDGAADVVTVGDLSSVSIRCVAFWVKPTTTTESFIQLKSSTQRSVEASSGTIGTTGLTNPLIYNNGVLTSVLQPNSWNHIVVSFDAVTDADDVLLGKEDTNFYDGTMEDVMFYSRILVGLEVERLNKSQLEGNRI